MRWAGKVGGRRVFWVGRKRRNDGLRCVSRADGHIYGYI